MARRANAWTLQDEIDSEGLAFGQLAPDLRAGLTEEASRRHPQRDTALWSLALVDVLGEYGFYRAAATLLYSLATQGRVQVVPVDRVRAGKKRTTRRKPASGA